MRSSKKICKKVVKRLSVGTSRDQPMGRDTSFPEMKSKESSLSGQIVSYCHQVTDIILYSQQLAKYLQVKSYYLSYIYIFLLRTGRAGVERATLSSASSYSSFFQHSFQGWPIQGKICSIQGDLWPIRGDTCPTQCETWPIQGDIWPIQGYIGSIQGYIWPIQGKIYLIQCDMVYTM